MVDLRFSSAAMSAKRSEIRELLKLTRDPQTISFGGGLPDPAIFPYEAVEKASQRVIKEQGRMALQYSPTEGEPFLKEQIAAYMTRQGEKVKTENILVVTSSQQGLDLLAKVFIDPGDPVVIERPSYVGTLQAFRAYRPEFFGVDLDFDGADPAELEKLVTEMTANGKKPKFIYLIPDFQNPSGINLTLERRKKILNMASRHDLLIAEDSPYRELRFTGQLIPSMYSLDTEERVVLMKTFSKIFCPGFRIGWVVGPSAVIEKMVIAKQGTDLCTSAYVSFMAAFLLQDGHVEKQIEISKKVYARKAKIMLEALDKYMPQEDGLTWSKPEGGMFLWIHLPEYMDTVEMLREAIVEHKVAYVIGNAFYYDGSGRNTMRINYSYPTDEQIVQGIERLSKVVTKRLKSRTAGVSGVR